MVSSTGVSRRGVCKLKRFMWTESPVEGARDKPVRPLANVASEGAALRNDLAAPKLWTESNVNFLTEPSRWKLDANGKALDCLGGLERLILFCGLSSSVS